MAHIFWNCEIMKEFWRAIQGLIQKVMQVTVEFSPILFLLHGSDLSLRAYKNSALPHYINAAHALITAKWKDTTPLTILNWIGWVNEVMVVKSLITAREGRSDRHEHIWTSWKAFQTSSKYSELTRQTEVRGSV